MGCQGYQGRGIAEEAARRSLIFLFNDLKAHKVIAITRDTNLRSVKLIGKLGFSRERHLRESGIQDGKRYGLLYYGMLRTEFSSEQH
jgi:RimJ/RimL family protein N-acetyltransferase